MTGGEQHETKGRRAVRWLQWQAQRMWGAVAKRGSIGWRGASWVAMIGYAVLMAGFSAYLLWKAFDLLSRADLAAAEEAAAVTAGAAAVTALATIALVWTTRVIASRA